MDPRSYWVAFNHVRGIGAVRLRSLMDFFGNLQDAWNAPVAGFQSAGLPPKVIENLVRVRSQVDPEILLAGIQQKGIRVLTWEDADYPIRLKQIEQSPPVLYVRGALAPVDEVAVAIVGTRRMTVYGRQAADELAANLVCNGVTIISGMALGVDAIAHESALKNGGRTLAVLGCGVDIIYPPEHRRLADNIMQNGALLSDYAPGTGPEAVNFPPRNRIISGLSLAVIIIEAGDTSGALITANFAVEQGREVFALPGNINSPQSRGTNRLIQQGAIPLLHPDDVLETLHLTQTRQKQAARTLLPADEEEACLMQVLGESPLHIDEIGNASGLSIAKVSATLAMLELKGLVRHVGGMNYVAAREARGGYYFESDG